MCGEKDTTNFKGLLHLKGSTDKLFTRPFHKYLTRDIIIFFLIWKSQRTPSLCSKRRKASGRFVILSGLRIWNALNEWRKPEFSSNVCDKSIIIHRGKAHWSWNIDVCPRCNNFWCGSLLYVTFNCWSLSGVKVNLMSISFWNTEHRCDNLAFNRYFGGSPVVVFFVILFCGASIYLG